MKVLRWLMLGLLLGWTAGCGAPPNGSTQEGGSQKLSDRVQSALQNVKTATQDQIEKQAVALVAELDRRVEDTERRAAESAEASVRESLEQVRMKLEEKRDEIRERLAALRDDTQTRDELRRDLSKTLTDLGTSIEEATRLLLEKPGNGQPPDGNRPTQAAS